MGNPAVGAKCKACSGDGSSGGVGRSGGRGGWVVRRQGGAWAVGGQVVMAVQGLRAVMLW